MNSRKSGNNKIKYKKSYCAFLDILGFQELVNSKSDNSIKKIELYFSLIEETKDYLQSISEKRDIGVMAISDSIVLSCEIPPSREDKLDKLRHFLIAINLIQAKLCKHDVWLRGGISYGDVSFSTTDSFIVGPGYVKAYTLEKSAKFPRVVIDVELVSLLSFDTPQEFIDQINLRETNGPQYDNWKTDIIFDWKRSPRINIPFSQDIPLFLDFLSGILKNSAEINEVIEHLKKNIKSDMRFYDKYRWVVDYLLTKTDQRILEYEEAQEYGPLFERLRML